MRRGVTENADAALYVVRVAARPVPRDGRGLSCGGWRPRPLPSAESAGCLASTGVSRARRPYFVSGAVSAPLAALGSSGLPDALGLVGSPAWSGFSAPADPFDWSDPLEPPDWSDPLG